MILLCLVSAGGLQHIRRLASPVATTFISSHTLCCRSLFRTGLNPAFSNKTAESAPVRYGINCYCEVISCSQADQRKAEVICCFFSDEILKR